MAVIGECLGVSAVTDGGDVVEHAHFYEGGEEDDAVMEVRGNIPALTHNKNTHTH